jgi:Na+/proline symporter
LIGVIFMIPYLQLQVTGLGIIVSVASFDGIGRTPAMAISVTLLSAFVLASGVRAVAWVSVLKDALMVIAAVAVGIGIPYIHYGGIGPMFSALAEVHHHGHSTDKEAPNEKACCVGSAGRWADARFKRECELPPRNAEYSLIAGASLGR